MRLRILAFATAADALGAPETELDFEDGLDVRELKDELEQRYPALGELWQRLAIAIDGEVVGDEATIPDGAEVALLPPVSGGRPEMPEQRTALVETPIDVDGVLRSVESPSRGAALLFLGNVRNHHAGRSVEQITYHAYRSMAERRLRALVAEIEAEHDDLALAVVHRLGPIDVGEASVAIAAASPHREASYAASRRALERLKAEVPIWKFEHYADGSERWREEEPLRVGD